MTSRIKALLGAVVAGASALLAYVANTPPEQQDALVGPLVALLPITWRPTIGLLMRGLSSIATVYMAFNASHSGAAAKASSELQTGESLPSPTVQPPSIKL